MRGLSYQLVHLVELFGIEEALDLDLKSSVINFKSEIVLGEIRCYNVLDKELCFGVYIIQDHR